MSYPLQQSYKLWIGTDSAIFTKSLVIGHLPGCSEVIVIYQPEEDEGMEACIEIKRPGLEMAHIASSVIPWLATWPL